MGGTLTCCYKKVQRPPEIGLGGNGISRRHLQLVGNGQELGWLQQIKEENAGFGNGHNRFNPGEHQLGFRADPTQGPPHHHHHLGPPLPSPSQPIPHPNQPNPTRPPPALAGGGAWALICAAATAAVALLLLGILLLAWRWPLLSPPWGGEGPGVPVPSEAQLELLDVGLAQFIHYDVNPFVSPHVEHNCAEAGSMDCLPASKFNPTDLDTDQWVEAAVAFGAKEVCLTAHHEGGFALWPTDHNLNYTVAASPYRGDILRQFVRSCQKRKIRICYYWGPSANGWLQQHAKSPQEFLALQHKQLEELLTQYGPVSRLWWDHYMGDGDGGCHPEIHSPCPMGTFPAAYPSFVEQVRQLSPGTIICPGPDCLGHLSELGVGEYPVWLTCKESATEPGTCSSRYGVPRGEIFMPRETCATPMASGWFADGEGSDLAWSLTDYWDHWRHSVGIGMVNTINAPPGTTGQIHPVVVEQMRLLGNLVRPLSQPLAIAGPAGAACRDLAVELSLAAAGAPGAAFNAAVAREDLRHGQRISGYTVEALPPGGGPWQAVAPTCPACAFGGPECGPRAGLNCIHGVTVGAMVVDLFELGWIPQRVRFRCLASLQDPVYLRTFAVAKLDNLPLPAAG